MADPVEENPVAEKEKKGTGKGLWAPSRGYFQVQVKAGAGGAPRAAPRAAATADLSKKKGPAPKKGEPAKEGAEAATAVKVAAKAEGEAAPKKEAATAVKEVAVKEGTVKAPAKPAAKPQALAPKKDPLRESVTAVPKLAESAASRAIAQVLYDEPDSETTLYRVPSLNVLFAVSSALLLLFTVLVVWQDYDRPWKVIQADWNDALTDQYEKDLATAKENQTTVLTGLAPRLEEKVGKLSGGDAAAAAIAKAAALGEKRGGAARVDALTEAVKQALERNIQ